MSVYSRDANRQFANDSEANSYGFVYCRICNDYLQNHDIALFHSGDNSNYHENPATGRRDNNLFIDRRGNDKSFSIGVEIEKIGEQGYSSIKAKDMWEIWKWRKERDGSLTSPFGHELVSPIFSLFGDNRLEDEINMPVIRYIINGKTDESCGGHIHIGSEIYTPKQLFEGFSAFFPLLYSLYQNRIHKPFSQAKEKYRYYTQANDHHTGIQILDKTVEFRIPSAVTNVKNLLWRIGLMRVFAKNINAGEKEIVSMMQNVESDLYKLLVKVISPENINIKIQKFIKYTEEYNWKKIVTSNIGETIRTESEVADV